MKTCIYILVAAAYTAKKRSEALLTMESKVDNAVPPPGRIQAGGFKVSTETPF